MTQSPWLDVKSAAEYLGVSKETVYRGCLIGGLKNVRVMGKRCYRFRKEWLDQWFESAAQVVAREERFLTPGIWDWRIEMDADGIVTKYDRLSGRKLPLPDSDFIGHHALEVLGPVEGERYLGMRCLAQKSGKPERVYVVYQNGVFLNEVHPDGTTLIAQVRDVSVPDMAVSA